MQQFQGRKARKFYLLKVWENNNDKMRKREREVMAPLAFKAQTCV